MLNKEKRKEPKIMQMKRNKTTTVKAWGGIRLCLESRRSL